MSDPLVVEYRLYDEFQHGGILKAFDIGHPCFIVVASFNLVPQADKGQHCDDEADYCLCDEFAPARTVEPLWVRAEGNREAQYVHHN